jgi:hypothetical protein
MKRSFTQTLALALVFAQSCVAATASSSNPVQTTQQPVATAAQAPDPLDDLDSTFIQAYTSLMASVTNSGQPYIVVAGNNLVLHRNGQQESVRVIPEIYHAFKDVAHIPFTIYLRLVPAASSGTALTDVQLAQLRSFSTQLVSGRAALPAAGFDALQLSRQQKIFDASVSFLSATIAAKQISSSSLESFTRAMAPLLLTDADDAACYQVQATHKQMMKWKSTLTSEEWNHLVVVNMSGHQPRYRNVETQYFGWLFNTQGPRWSYPGESARMIYAESLSPGQGAADELAAVEIDADAARSFFGNEWRLSEDLLSDGAAKCIAKLPVADRQWQ